MLWAGMRALKRLMSLRTPNETVDDEGHPLPEAPDRASGRHLEDRS